VIAEAAAALAGLALLRWGVHRGILRGLSAPRVRHAHGPNSTGLPAGTVCQMQVDGPQGRRLFATFVSAPAADDAPAPRLAWRLPYPVIGWYVLCHVQKLIGARFDGIAPLHTLPRVRCPVLLVHFLRSALG
jgi:hypothetical protein